MAKDSSFFNLENCCAAAIVPLLMIGLVAVLAPEMGLFILGSLPEGMHG